MTDTYFKVAQGSSLSAWRMSRSWLKVLSALCQDSPPSASLDHLTAEAAPTYPAAQPEQLGSFAVAPVARLRPLQR